MSKYFDRFPNLTYDIDGKRRSTYQITTDIFFRMGVVQSVLSNISAYYEYMIKDYDTPEILASKVYQDPEAHWIILLANKIVDPQYDWPLNSTQFSNYIIGKYGSIATAQITAHHYEKVIQREETLSGIVTETRFQVNYANLTSSMASTTETLPYDYYTDLPETQEVQTFNVGDGRTVIQTTFRDTISCYDYEDQLNEAKRSIKIIKPEYYPQIVEEFNKLTKNGGAPYIRKLV